MAYPSVSCDVVVCLYVMAVSVSAGLWPGGVLRGVVPRGFCVVFCGFRHAERCECLQRVAWCRAVPDLHSQLGVCIVGTTQGGKPSRDHRPQGARQAPVCESRSLITEQ